jgi:hypothetical protein
MARTRARRRGAELRNKGGRALDAAGLHVDEGMFCRTEGGQRFSAAGEVRLFGAHTARGPWR